MEPTIVHNDLLGILDNYFNSDVDLGLTIKEYEDADDLGIESPNPCIVVSDAKGNQCQIIIKKMEA